MEIEPGMQNDQEKIFHGEGEPHMDGESGLNEKLLYLKEKNRMML